MLFVTGISARLWLAFTPLLIYWTGSKLETTTQLEYDHEHLKRLHPIHSNVAAVICRFTLGAKGCADRVGEEAMLAH